MMFIHEETGYDLWSDPAYDYLDYEELLTEEYKDLGYNPRNVNANFPGFYNSSPTADRFSASCISFYA